MKMTRSWDNNTLLRDLPGFIKPGTKIKSTWRWDKEKIWKAVLEVYNPEVAEGTRRRREMEVPKFSEAEKKMGELILRPWRKGEKALIRKERIRQQRLKDRRTRRAAEKHWEEEKEIFKQLLIDEGCAKSLASLVRHYSNEEIGIRSDHFVTLVEWDERPGLHLDVSLLEPRKPKKKRRAPTGPRLPRRLYKFPAGPEKSKEMIRAERRALNEFFNRHFWKIFEEHKCRWKKRMWWEWRNDTRSAWKAIQRQAGYTPVERNFSIFSEEEWQKRCERVRYENVRYNRAEKDHTWLELASYPNEPTPVKSPNVPFFEIINSSGGVCPEGYIEAENGHCVKYLSKPGASYTEKVSRPKIFRVGKRREWYKRHFHGRAKSPLFNSKYIPFF